MIYHTCMSSTKTRIDFWPSMNTFIADWLQWQGVQKWRVFSARKPSLSYLPLSHELARGRSLNLCSFFLGAFYRGMASLQLQLKNGVSPTGSGPLWLAQL